MPMVADIDNDETPEVISSNSSTGWIYILNGKDGTTERSIDSGLGSLFSYPAVADVDKDGTGELFIVSEKGEIKAYNHDLTNFWGGNVTSCYTTFGRQLGLADFNGDGTVELYQVNEIRNAQTGNVIIAGSHNTSKYPSANNWETELNATPVAVDILPDSYCTDCKGLELVVGHIIYSVDIAGGKLTERLNMNDATTKPAGYPAAGYFTKNAGFTGQSYSSTSIVDFNTDGTLDIIMGGTTGNAYGPTTVFFWDYKNSTVKSFVVTRPAVTIPDIPPSNIRQNFRDLSGNSCDNGEQCTWYRGVGTLNIADIDNASPGLEVTFMSGSSLYALDNNFTLKWQNNTDFWESSSGFTGTAVFDFDGDGQSEIIYRDEIDLYIVKGKDGNIANSDFGLSTFCSSQTQADYPIVADVDGDGETEIIVSCGQLPNTSGDINTATGTNRQNGHIKAYKAANGNYWVPARKIWNQFTYFNVNVNDNMTIPKYQQAHHLNFAQICKEPNAKPNFSLNKFLNQSPRISYCGNLVFPAAKLDFRSDSVSVVPPVCPENTFQVRLFFENNGDAAVNQPIPVSFYSANPLVGHNPSEEPYLYTQEFSVAGGLQPGAHLDTTITVVGQRGDFRLYVSLNDRGQYDENGSLVPNSSYYPLKKLNGPVRECDGDPTIVSKAIVARPYRVLASTISDNLNCKGVSNNNGEVEVTKEDGSAFSSADYTFTWTDSNGKTVGTTAYVGSLPAGSYVVKVTGTKFTCSSIPDTAVVDLKNSWSEFDVVTTESLKEVSNCKDKTADGEARVLINGVEPNLNDYDIEWTNQESGATVSLQPHAKALEAYVHYVRIVNKLSGCAETGIIDMTLKRPKFSVIAKGNPNNCVNPNGTIQLAPEEGNAADYGYFLVTSTGDKIETNVNGVFSNLASGVYSAYMYNPANDCGKFSNSLPVTLLAEKTIFRASGSVAKNQTACEAPYNGQLTVNIADPADYNYHWYKLDASGNQVTVGTSASTPDTLSRRQYFVTIQSKSTLCDTLVSVTLTEALSNPTVTVTTTDQTYCTANGAATAIALPAGTYTYVLLKGNTILESNTTGTFANLAQGPYTIRAKSGATRCSVTSAVFNIKENLVPFGTVNFVQTKQKNCAATSPNADGALEVNVNGSTTGYTFAWFKGIDTTTAISPQPATPYKLENIPSGDYTVKITNTTTGCDSVASFFLEDAADNYRDSISAKVNQEYNFCTPGPNGVVEAVLTSKAGQPTDVSNYIFHWYKGTKSQVKNNSAAILPEQSAILSNLDGGTYAVWAERIGTVYCDALDTAVVTVQDLRYFPKLDVKIKNIAQSSCSDDENKHNGRLEANVGDTTTGFKFNWYTNNNGVKIAFLLDNPIASGLTVGQYFLEIVNEKTGCAKDTMLIITSNIAEGSDVKLILTPSPVTACDPNDGSITVSDVEVKGMPTGDPGAYKYDWYMITKPGKDSVQVGFATGPTITGLDQGNYSVKAINDTTSCESVFWPVTVGRNPILDIDFGFTPRPQDSCFPPNGELEVLFVDPSANASDYTYQWYIGKNTDVIMAGKTNYKIIGLRASHYTVAVTSNATGCTTIKTWELGANLSLRPVANLVDVDSAISCSTPNGSIVMEVDPTTLATYQANEDPGYLAKHFWFYWFKNEVKYKSPLANVGDINHPDNLEPLFVPSNADNRATISGLEAGTYILMVVDRFLAPSYGCASVLDTIIVDEAARKPDVDSFTVTDNTFCSSPNGSITVTTKKRTGDTQANTGFTFNWFNSDVPGVGNGDEAKKESITSAPYMATYNGLADGNYSVRIVDNTTGCDTTMTFKVEDRAIAPVIDKWTVVDQLDCNVNKGSIEITQLNNSFPLADHDFYWYAQEADYELGTPATNAIFTGNPLTNQDAGIYWVVAVSKITGCTSLIQDIEIKDKRTPSDIVLVTQNDNTICDPVNGNGELSITISEVGGILPPAGYTISWTGIDVSGNPITGITATDNQSAYPATSTISNLNAGTYTVTVANLTTLCTAVTGTWEILDTPIRPEFVFNGGTSDVSDFCITDGHIVINQIKFDGTTYNAGDAQFADVTFTWRYGTDDTAGETAFTNLVATSTPVITLSANGHELNNLPDGDYFVQATHVNGCTSATNQAFEISKAPKSPFVSGGMTSPFIECTSNTEGEIAIKVDEDNASIPNSNYTFQWSDINHIAITSNISSPSASESVISNLTDGQYIVEVTNNDSKCISIDTFTVTKKMIPLQLYASKTQDVTNCAPANGAAQIDYVLFDQTNRPLSDFTFEWFYETTGNPLAVGDYGLATDGLSANALIPGKYLIRATDTNDNSCQTGYFTVTIADNTVPFYVLPVGDVVNITGCDPAGKAVGKLEISALNNTGQVLNLINGNYTIAWYEGKVADPNNPLGSDVTLENLVPGYYTTVVTDITTGCTSQLTQQIISTTLETLLTTEASRYTSCISPDGKVFAKVSGASGTYQFDWYKGTDTTVPPFITEQSKVSSTVENLTSGKYTVVVNNLDEDGCDKLGTEVIVEDGRGKDVIVDIMHDFPVTNCDVTNPNGQLSASVNGERSRYNFFWYKGRDITKKPIAQGPVASNLAPDTYTVVARDKITGCLSDEFFTKVEQVADTTKMPPVTVNVLSHVTHCAKPNGIAQAVLDSALVDPLSDYEYIWTDKNNREVYRSTRTGIVTNLAAGDYQVTVYNVQSGCLVGTSEVTIKEKLYNPDFEIVTSPSVCMQATGTIFLQFTEAIDIVDILWETPVGYASGFSLNSQPPGEYHVTITDGNGCKTTRSATIKATLFTYNGVSPNGDGKNDKFLIGCIESYETQWVRIYNRAGALVYENLKYDNDADYFDGHGNRGLYIGGDKLPSGTYFYIIDIKNGEKPVSGYLELTR